jgi:hypothetical protein
MNNQKGSIVIVVLIILAVLYAFLFFLSYRGWGYAGYYNRHHYGPSFWYWGGPRYYTGASVRTGSYGGPSHVGGGPGAGK